jgi:hypothetical protein
MSESEVEEEVKNGQWDYICGTTDVPSTLSRGIDEEGRIWLHFTFGEQGYLDAPLDDFLAMYRLFVQTTRYVFESSMS